VLGCDGALCGSQGPCVCMVCLPIGVYVMVHVAGVLCMLAPLLVLHTSCRQLPLVV
jgi:hypothetical protein